MAKKGDNDPRNYLPFSMCGTTFSGDPHTTLGNTLRNICYMNFYLRDAGFDYQVFAAGDDGVILTRNQRAAERAAQLVFERTGRNAE